MISRKLTAVLALVASANVFAQADNFSGFSVGLNTGFNSNTALYDSNTSSASTSNEIGRRNTPFNLNSSYTFALSQNGTFGVGINYDLTNTKFSDKSTSDDYNLTSTLKNHYSVNFEPGYAFNDSTLGYFKVSYESAKISLQNTTTSTSKSTTGYGYGFGAKYLLDKNLYMNLEIYQATLNKVTATLTTSTSFTPKILTGTVGVGYKF